MVSYYNTEGKIKLVERRRLNIR